APDAATQAAARGAHRQAIEHYHMALRYTNQMALKQHAELLDGLSHEFVLTGRIADAVPPCEEALALWQTLNQQEQVGHTLRQLARVYWNAAQRRKTDQYIDAAAQVLEPLPPSKELGWTYNYRAIYAMLAEETNAQEWSERALALAKRL